MASRPRRTQRGKSAAEPELATPPSSSRKRKRQQPTQPTDTTSDEGSSLDSATSPATAPAAPAASLTDIAVLNDQSLSAVNQLLSKRYKKPVAHSTVAQPQRHDEANGTEDESKHGEEEAVWETDDTAAHQLQPIVAVADGEHHEMDDDMWQTDDMHHADQPPPLESADHSYPHSDTDDEQHSLTRPHRTTSEEAEAYRQQQLEAIATAASLPSASTQLSHRTEVSLDDDNQPTSAEQGGAISIELPKDLVAAPKSTKPSKADKAAAAAAKEKKKQAPRLTAEAKALQVKMQKLHLLSSIALLQRYSAVADNEELQGQLLSLLPPRLMLTAGMEEPMSPASGASTGSVEVTGGTNVAMATFGVDWVKQITSWYHHLIFLAQAPSSSSSSPPPPSSSPISSSSPSSSSSVLPLSLSPLTSLCSLGHLPFFFNCLAAQLTSVLSLRRSHSPHAKLLLFLALLRSLHINVRLVHAIEQTAYPWEQQGWMDELRRIAVSTRVKADVGQLKEMRIGGRMVQVIDKRDNLRRMWRVALPRSAVDGYSGCACGSVVEWRYAGLAGTVVPPARSVSLIGCRVSITRADNGDRDEVVIDGKEEEARGKSRKKVKQELKKKRSKAQPVAASERDDEKEQEEDTPLARKLAKKEKHDASPVQQRNVVERERAPIESRPASPTSSTPKAMLKAEADQSNDRVKSKRKKSSVSEKRDEEQREDDHDEDEDDDAAVYAASMRRRKAKAGKPVKEEKGQRRSERVKQQVEADVIVLSSDDEDEVVRIKQQAEAREREMLRRLQEEEDERQEEEEGEEEMEEEAENMVRPKQERPELSDRKKEKRKKAKAVKRRLMNEENLVSSEDSDGDSHSALPFTNGHSRGDVERQVERLNGNHAPALFTLQEEEDEPDDVPLVSSSTDHAVNSIASAVSSMMNEAKQAGSSNERQPAPASIDETDEAQPEVITAPSSAVGVGDEEVRGVTAKFRQTSCYVCGSHRPTASNPILLCDACDRECHLKCTSPPLNKVPKGNWYCQHCAEQKEDGAAADDDEQQWNGKIEKEEKDPDEDDFVPTKRPKRSARVDGKRKRSAKADVKTAKADEASQRSHVFDRYQFGSQSHNGKEEKVEQHDAAADEEEDDADAADGDNSSVMEDVTPRKQQKGKKKRSTKREPLSASSASSSSPTRSRRSSSATSSSPSASSSKSKGRSAATDPTGLFLPFWVEVYCPAQECWIHVDPVNNLVDATQTYESLRPRRTFSYVLAAYPPIGVLQRLSSSMGLEFAFASATALPYMAGLGRVILSDVTARYGVGSAMLPRGRLDEQWWESTLTALSASRASAHDRRIHDTEQASFQSSRSTSLAELPTTLAAMKKHPLYISLDQIKKFEMLRPGAPIAARTTIGKQHVSLYWRKDVHLLHTVERWVREKRQVREDEVGKPAKLVKSQTMAGRKKRKIMQYARAMHGDFDRLSLDAAVQDIATSLSASTSASTLPDDDEQSALYGVWQTDPWAPPAAKDGLVPRNARGQVDLWTPAHLPLGCVHLPYPRIAAIARKLGVDYAEAMVGFEVRGGRSIPRFDGIVVIERNAEWVLDAYREREREVKEREDKKRWERVSFNWRRLVKGAVVRAKLMAELKERNESGEGQEEEQKSGKKASKHGKRGRKEEDNEEAGGKKGGKRGVPKGSGDAEVVNDLNHVHDFTSNKTMNRETGSWIATCRCGARNEFEDL